MSASALAFGIVCSLLLLSTLLHTAIGMWLTAIALAVAGGMIFSVATGGIHEATASILVVGAAVCTGLAGLSRDLKSRSNSAGHNSDPERAN